MPSARAKGDGETGRYGRICARAARRGRGPRSDPVKESEIAACLSQAGIQLRPETVLKASRTFFRRTLTALGVVAALLFVLWGANFGILGAFVAVMGALIAKEAVLAYPRTAALKRASSVMRTSTEAVNIMIVCLRHEPSLPNAMRSAAAVASEFGEELRSSIWSVVMGAHSTFEEALQALAARWGEHSRELKAALHALITASCEGSEEGRRSALDRASSSLVSGARRRIEDYALGLSLPSMMLFSIGVLLPLMVGSFLPMMSWDMWASIDDPSSTATWGLSDGVVLRTVLAMNVLFPAIALLIAVDAVSRHPIASGERESAPRARGQTAFAVACAVACGAVGLLGSDCFLEGTEKWVGLTLSCFVPAGACLIVAGEQGARTRASVRKGSAEDLLFSVGARLVEGDNLESAVRKAAGRHGPSLRPGFVENGAGVFDLVTGHPASEGSVAEASRVVVRAAAKDEAQAGMLAMDLSRYIKDLSDLELTLRRRLRPTVSMMRLTSHVLAPLMLGVTYAIYLSLASIGGGDMPEPGVFLLVLGAFLVEMNSVVAYFVWGIGERMSVRQLEHSVGACALVATLVYSATILMVS
jgi:hypothetical protein